MVHTIIRSLPRATRVTLLCLLALLSLPSTAAAQTAAEPERETLLNGLNILYWSRPGDPNVVLRLRIHSGAAFDLAGKGGMMALLGDAFFPDPATREYVADDLGGRLEVTTTHDSTDILLSGKASALERMIDLLRGALVTTQLGVENVAALRSARIKLLSDKPATPSEIADQAITARLFGSFPYAHPASGTPATLQKVERADLLLARERFLNADNASLAVIGGVDKGRLMRALRQLLGPWGKSDRMIPSTFRQPPAPDARVLALDNANASGAEIRLAVRGLSRSDSDTAAASLLASIIRYRWQAAAADLSSVSVQHESHLLPGVFILKASSTSTSAPTAISAAQEVINSLMKSGPGAAELDRARAEYLIELSRQWSQTESIAAAWLDVDTFKSRPPNTLATFINSLTVGDLQRVATRLFKDAPVATVVVGNYDQLKTAFAGKLEPQLTTPSVKTSDPAIPAKKP